MQQAVMRCTARVSALIAACILALWGSSMGAGQVVFPDTEWHRAAPESRGADAAKLNQIATMLEANGCIIRDGYVVKSWGAESERCDWASSAKPIFSTLLFFAIEESKVASVDEKLSKWGWPLRGKDAELTFRHLADMTTNYMQPEGPRQAWDYNDYAIALYVQTLERVFGQSISEAAQQRLYGPLGMQDNPYHVTAPTEGKGISGRARLSVRDFGRLCWFWLNRGEWDGRQLLPRRYFDEYMKPDVPTSLPFGKGPRVFGKRAQDSIPEDYLGVKSFGGSTNQHGDYGPGIYGFNWWFNAPGRFGPNHPRAGEAFACTWPGVPSDTIMTSGAGGHHSVMIPSLRIVLVSGGGKWKGPTMDPANPDYFNNTVIRLLADSVRGEAAPAR